ncbi:MAG: outer membrane beta-barrel protein [Opitutales bacterium]|nr:outer membrane beta-barrel protein [Opitutales bacterium]MCH8540728.1 outer membrane beta-barrel protein [Opitutales bacterium]
MIDISKCLKKLALGGLFTGVPFATLASPLISIGENGAIFFNSSATFQWNDNIFLDSQNEVEDFIFILTPGLEFSVLDTGDVGLRLFYREDFYLYADNSHLDFNASHVDADFNYNTEVLEFRAGAALQQTRQNTQDVNIEGNQVRRTVLSGEMQGEYAFSDIFSVGLGFTVRDTDYKNQSLRDNTVYTVPVDVYYAVTPLTSLSFGYRYRYSDVQGTGTGNATDHFFNIGARGEFTPALEGRIFAGYQYRDFENIGSIDGLSYGADVNYEFTPLLQGFFTLERDYRLNSAGGTVEATGAYFRLDYSIDPKVTLKGGISYYHHDYRRGAASGRRDDYVVLNLGGDYTLNEYTSISANYRLRNNESNRFASEFTNNTISLSASVRY